MTLKEKAIEYCKKGFAVFPLTPRGKIPATKDGFKSATTDEKQVEQWWDSNPDYNIGIATGQLSKGVFAIDLDIKEDINGLESLRKWEQENEPLLPTVTSVTGSGGLHILYFSDKPVKNKVNLYPGIDIRGDGGYIVAPPSVHPNGKIYQWKQENKNIKRANDVVMKFLEGNNKPEIKPDNALKQGFIPEGQRTDTLFKLACSLQAKGLSDTAIRTAIKAENQSKCKPPLSDSELEREVFQALQRYPKGVPTYSQTGNTEPVESIIAFELYHKEIPPLKWYVENILPTGTNMLAAPPKTNKSWFALSAGLNIAKGESFLGFNTTKTGVLYLALEDSERRLQQRMIKLLKGTEPPKNFWFWIKAKTINTGLFDDFERHIQENPSTGFIIIDTLQKVRDATNNKNVYAADYQDLGALKAFADKHDIALLILHHTRKMKDTDVFNNISGTNGVLGAVDTTLIFSKEKREDTKIKMDVTGRDVYTETYDIEFRDYEFHMLGVSQTLEELKADFDYRHNPIVVTIKELLSENCNEWSGTATELKHEMLTRRHGYKDEKTIGRELKALQENLYLKDSISYTYGKSTGKKLHRFSNRITLNIP